MVTHLQTFPCTKPFLILILHPIPSLPAMFAYQTLCQIQIVSIEIGGGEADAHWHLMRYTPQYMRRKIRKKENVAFKLLCGYCACKNRDKQYQNSV